MTTAQRIGGILVLGGAAALLYLWWKRRKTTSLSDPKVTSANPTASDIAIGLASGDVSWTVAPVQSGTPNTPTVDPVWAHRNPGTSPV